MSSVTARASRWKAHPTTKRRARQAARRLRYDPRMADVPVVVVGPGVLGLAVAAHLAPRHPDLVILDRRERHSTETSSRNSEVIHAGMYYPPGTLKTRLCVEGNARLYKIYTRHNVPHRRTSKIITATTET